MRNTISIPCRQQVLVHHIRGNKFVFTFFTISANKEQFMVMDFFAFYNRMGQL